ncbi:MAG: type II secretion system F family protein [Chlamydiales bacterium]|nr:type II secretion system F family protein [Chlamydiales bacterium]
MPVFNYFAVDAEGKECSGAIDAHTERDVRSVLRLQGLVLTKLKQVKREAFVRFTKLELLTFTQQLRQLLEAGLPLYDSLVTLEGQFKDKKWHRLLLGLCEHIQRGSSFSNALEQYTHLFDRTYIAMVRAGELSGSLSSIFVEICAYLEKQLKLQKQIINSLIYPMILLGFASIVIMLLLFFVIPSIEALFESKELEGLTYVVLQASLFARNYGDVSLLFLALVISFIFWKKRAIKQSRITYELILRIPMLKMIFVRVALARFFRTLATLQKGGVSLLEALFMSREVMNFPPLEKVVADAQEKIVEGSKLSIELKKSSLIPPLVYRMLAVGEECGSSVVTYQKMAEMYEEEVEKNIARYTAIAQPIILIFMGAVVGIVMLAVLLPLTDTSILMGE